MNYLMVLFLGWMIPGAGHVALGQAKKGALFFALIVGTVLTGFYLTGWQFVRWQDNYFYFLGKFGSGGIWLLCDLLTNGKPIPPALRHQSFFDPGLLYICSAGLLNVVVVLNVFRPEKTEEESTESSDEATEQVVTAPIQPIDLDTASPSVGGSE